MAEQATTAFLEKGQPRYRKLGQTRLPSPPSKVLNTSNLMYGAEHLWNYSFPL